MKKFKIYRRLAIAFAVLALVAAALGAITWAIPAEVSDLIGNAAGIFGVESGFDLTSGETRELTLLILIGAFGASLLLQLIFMIKAFSRAGDLLAIAGAKRQTSIGVAKASTGKSKTKSGKEDDEVKTIKERKAEAVAKKAAKAAEKAAAKAEKIAKKAAKADKAVEESEKVAKETVETVKKSGSKIEDLLKDI
jgi:hypothetical protein